MGDELPVQVYFTYELEEMNDPVTAVFVDSFGQEGPDLYTVYARVGQHSTGHPAWIAERTRPATPAEYGPLLAELGRIGYVAVPVKSLDTVPR